MFRYNSYKPLFIRKMSTSNIKLAEYYENKQDYISMKKHLYDEIYTNGKNKIKAHMMLGNFYNMVHNKEKVAYHNNQAAKLIYDTKFGDENK